eukprot:symbB.v1.2.005598.t1/scaffold326.1/size228935/20
MGYNSWNDLECRPSEWTLKAIAEKLKNLGFLDLGYEYVVVDDCWMIRRNALTSVFSTMLGEMQGKMRKACGLAAEALVLACEAAKAGVTTDEVDRRTGEFVIGRGAYPVGINYYGFPRGLCASPNEVALHGVPNTRPLEEGDIVNFDVTVYLDGAFGDCSAMVCVGNIDENARFLVDATKQCLDEAVELVGPGLKLNQIGQFCYEFARKRDLHVVSQFCGHFIGSEMHMLPNVMHADSEMLASECQELGYKVIKVHGATRADFQQGFREALQAVAGTSGALLLIAFSGHGVEVDRRMMWAPEDVEPNNLSTYFDVADECHHLMQVHLDGGMSYFGNGLQPATGLYQVILADCCRVSVPLDTSHFLPSESKIRRRAKKPKMYIIYSCGPGKEAIDASSSSLSPFMQQVKENLRISIPQSVISFSDSLNRGLQRETGSTQEASGMLEEDEKAFPSGMKALGDYLHGMGFKYGIYTDRGLKTCASRPASFGFEAQDGSLFASWDVDFLKNDGCVDPDCGDVMVGFAQSGKCDDEGKKKTVEKYRRMAEALNTSGRPIVHSICGWNPWFAGIGRQIGHMWRGDTQLCKEECTHAHPTLFGTMLICIISVILANTLSGAVDVRAKAPLPRATLLELQSGWVPEAERPQEIEVPAALLRSERSSDRNRVAAVVSDDGQISEDGDVSIEELLKDEVVKQQKNAQDMLNMPKVVACAGTELGAVPHGFTFPENYPTDPVAGSVVS